MSARMIGILGLARSGRAAARLALSNGDRVYASDTGDSPELRAAAEEIRNLGGRADVGGHALDALAQCDVIVLSPGIPPTAAVLQAPRIRGVPRISELEYAYRSLRAPVIAVTGTNGKTTTTALTTHLLRSGGMAAEAAGNIGLALSDIALRSVPPAWVVVEASSFQLAGVETFAPQIGVLTNLAADHLDRYPSIDAYHADKRRMFDNAAPDNTWVLNGEDAAVLRLGAGVAGRHHVFRVVTPLEAAEQGAYIAPDGDMRVRIGATETSLGSVTELRLLGRHNHANALAAALAALAAGASTVAVASGLHSFGGLEHRLEVVGEWNDVLWVNDSKATNVGAAIVALRSIDRPIVLLLGGRPKGESFADMLPDLTGRVRHVIAFGEALSQIVAELGDAVPVEPEDGPFTDVVARAVACARPGDAVLLAPACASFDMFRDYEERGRTFKALAAGAQGGPHG